MTPPKAQLGSEVGCFCDGNGAVDCDECAGEGVTQPFCGDDLCVGNDCFHDMPTHVCRICKGSGFIVCPAHDYGDDDAQGTASDAE